MKVVNNRTAPPVPAVLPDSLPVGTVFLGSDGVVYHKVLFGSVSCSYLVNLVNGIERTMSSAPTITVVESYPNATVHLHG